MPVQPGRPREEWPSRELLDYFVATGDDFELRRGEHTPVDGHDAAAVERARRFRDVLGLFCTGITVVTGFGDGHPVGLTCQSFASVSLEPPLVMFCPARTSQGWPVMQDSGAFCANILGAGQRQLSEDMATKGAHKFDGVAWRPAPTGSPVLAGVLGYVDCVVEQVHEAGDHYIVVGRVRALGVGDLGQGGSSASGPLLFHRGTYTRLGESPDVPRA